MTDRKVKANDKVKVHYKGTLESGEEFDSSYSRNEPLLFTVGSQEVILGFDKGVLDMAIGEKRTLDIPPGDAYGDYDNALVQTVKRSVFPKDVNPAEGNQFLVGENEYQTLVRVVKVEDDKITLDANHVLAGKKLKFEIELVEIVS